MKIGIGIIAYNVVRELDDLLKSISESYDHSPNGYTVYLHQHSTREAQPAVTEVCERWAKDDYNVRYTYHGANRGLSASWNDALYQGYEVDKCDVVLLVNDDITFLPGAIDRLAEYVVSTRSMDGAPVGMVTALGYHYHYAKHPELGEQPLWGFGFSCFSVNPAALDAIGYFDENIAPIYFEDCDWGERLYRAGMRSEECKDAGIIHWGSLSAQQAGQAEILSKASPVSIDYLCRKWGLRYNFNTNEFLRYFGEESRQICPTPFNDPAFGLKIPAERRHQPYGPLYDRYDIRGRKPIGNANVPSGEWPGTFLVPNMPEGYEQPFDPEYTFRPGSGGNSIWDHMVRLADFAKHSNGVIVEVGSGCGDGSTHAFDVGLQANPAEYKRHISVCLHPVAGDWEPKADYWRMVVGDSNDKKTVALVENLLTDVTYGDSEETRLRDKYEELRTPGIIYIDTDHTYECLKRELEIWPAIGDEHTLYLFHDVIGFPDMAKAIEEAAAPGGRFHETHDYRILWPTCSGLGALTPRKGWPVV